MASEAELSGVTHPMMVGEAFVNQYYQILSQSPELVHRFYQDCSRLGRLNASGMMETITLMNAINERILASDASKFRSEIQTIDVQESQKGGVLILVTGHLLLQESKRNFIQTFFLAPQEKGYFVLNDIFRYIDLKESLTVDTQESYNNGVLMLMTGKDDMKKGFTQVLFLAQKEKGFFVLNDLSENIGAAELEYEVKHEKDFVRPEEIISAKNNPSDFVLEEEPKNNPSETAEKTLNVVYEVTEIERVEKLPNGSGSVITFGDPPPKKTYASIVKVLKDNAVPSSAFVAVPARTLFKPFVAQENQPITSPSRISENPGPEIADIQESEDAFMIYVKNLPLNSTPTQLEEEFKRFGSIKPGGIQVRSSKQHGFCYGFVEFESASAVQQAIKASPVLIGGRQTYIEEKRHSGSRANGPRQHAALRGSFRGDGPRPRGSYNGNNRSSRRPSDFEGRNGSRGGYQQSNRSVAIPPGVSASA